MQAFIAALLFAVAAWAADPAFPRPVDPSPDTSNLWITGNLVQNPGGDEGVAHWQKHSGGFGVFSTNKFPAKDLVGTNYFFGGYTGYSSESQWINVTEYADAIDAGQAIADIGALIGGFNSDNDYATVQFAFRSQPTTSSSLLTWTTPRATDVQRNYVTKLLRRAVTAPVPVGVRFIQVNMAHQRTWGDSNDGYVDDVFVSLRLPPRLALNANLLAVPGAEEFRLPGVLPVNHFLTYWNMTSLIVSTGGKSKIPSGVAAFSNTATAGTEGSGTQVVAVGAMAADIDASRRMAVLRVTLSGPKASMGKPLMKVTAQPLGSAGAPLGDSAVLVPRDGVDVAPLTLETALCSLPVGTRHIRVTVAVVAPKKGLPPPLVDNIDLRLLDNTAVLAARDAPVSAHRLLREPGAELPNQFGCLWNPLNPSFPLVRKTVSLPPGAVGAAVFSGGVYLRVSMQVVTVGTLDAAIVDGVRAGFGVLTVGGRLTGEASFLAVARVGDKKHSNVSIKGTGSLASVTASFPLPVDVDTLRFVLILHPGAAADELHASIAVVTPAPSSAPTQVPTDAPSAASSTAPTGAPTEAHTQAPTLAPTDAPSPAPATATTDSPSEAPSTTGHVPTPSPTEPTPIPTVQLPDIVLPPGTQAPGRRVRSIQHLSGPAGRGGTAAASAGGGVCTTCAAYPLMAVAGVTLVAAVVMYVLVRRHRAAAEAARMACESEGPKSQFV